MSGFTPVHQEFVKGVKSSNQFAKMYGDVEYIEFNHTTGLYESHFGPDLPTDFQKTKAYNKVAARNGEVFLVANTPEPLEYNSRLLRLNSKMTKWELTPFALTPRTNGTVFLYQVRSKVDYKNIRTVVFFDSLAPRYRN